MPKGVFVRSEECNRINSESKKKSYENGRIPANRGVKFSEEHRIKMGVSKFGKNNPMWKGGITKEIKLLRMSAILKIWREKVFMRDKFTCQNPNCPHCNNKNYGSIGSPYMICGYTPRGFDWKGCGKDWCFRCEKLLCKKWEINSLHFELNRIHTDECCSKHANEMGNVYYSVASRKISIYKKKRDCDETMAFENFMDWLMFYLEKID